MHTALTDKIPISRLALHFVIVSSVSEVAADVLITGSLFYGLLRQKSEWAQTDRLVKRIMRLIMETQTSPAITSLIFMIMSIVTSNGTSLAAFIFYAKVHVICLLIVVNSRIGLAASTVRVNTVGAG